MDKVIAYVINWVFNGIKKMKFYSDAWETWRAYFRENIMGKYAELAISVEPSRMAVVKYNGNAPLTHLYLRVNVISAFQGVEYLFIKSLSSKNPSKLAGKWRIDFICSEALWHSTDWRAYRAEHDFPKDHGTGGYLMLRPIQVTGFNIGDIVPRESGKAYILATPDDREPPISQDVSRAIMIWQFYYWYNSSPKAYFLIGGSVLLLIILFWGSGKSK